MGHPWIALRACVLALVLLVPRPTLAATLTVAWDPEADAAGFVVYYGTSSGAYTGSVDAGNATQKQIDTLANGTLYYFAVVAYDSDGLQGMPSDEVIGTTSGAAVVTPLAIQCPAPSGSSSNGLPLRLNFSPNVSGGVAPITSSCTPSSGSLFPLGSTALTCTATDARGTQVSCQSAVIVAATPIPVEFDAQVSNLANRCPDTTFTAIWASLAPQTFAVVTTSATTYARGACAALRNTDNVHVQGVAANGRVVATAITFLAGNRSPKQN
jgi:hypothetical protein